MDDFDYADIKKLRDLAGLPKYKPGKVSCLRCDETFNSWDIKLKRICSQCSVANEDKDNGVPLAKLITRKDFLK